MNRSTPLLLAVLAIGVLAPPSSTALAGPGGPGTYGKDGDPAPLAETVAPLVERAIAAGWEPELLEELFLAALLEHGDVAPLVNSLSARVAATEDTDAGHRTGDPIRRVLAFIQWRNGDLRQALSLLEQVPASARTLGDRLRLAELLDATGRSAEARDAYQALVDADASAPPGDDPLSDGDALSDDEEVRLRLRIALMATDRRTADGEEASELFRYARDELQSTELRNRAAIVLALTKRPKEAGQLYTVDGAGSDRFKQEVRLAEWALDADDIEGAREIAWRARESATLRRDRWYALSILVEAWREGDQLDALIDRFDAEQTRTTTEPDAAEFDTETREVWIDLLREQGRLDDALALFRESAESGFTFDMRRELLEMCRESGRDDILVDAYRELIADQPEVMEWREGFARHYLERGDRDAAIALWRAAQDDPALKEYALAAADSMAALGLDDLAMESAERCIAEDRSPYQALLFRFSLLRDRGRRPEAEAELERMDALAPQMAPERMALAEAFEQIGRLERAVEVLEGVRVARGPEKAGEDLEMRLAWLHSEIGDEDTAMERWLDLWHRVESLSRRRYVEDRLMTVASRIGKLADIAISLEERLMAGEASEKDAGLLVRLYSKANDPVSAAEIIEEHMKRSGSSAIDILREKARIYQECNDFHSFEQVMHQLIEHDTENRVDHLRQLAMSALERGRPDEAKDVLAQLRELEGGAVGAEFEAGVLALSGLRDEALLAYRTGLASHQDRIEVYLLLANVLRDTGKTAQAIGMFQYLAEHADKDDLFTIAIDGLLNMEAPAPVVRWARRITFERMTYRHDKLYLYQLISDLSDEVNDADTALLALEGSLPIAGEQRASILRELMDRTGAPRQGQPSRDEKRHLAYGRRLISLGDIVPPQVYLDLGDAFLKNDEVTNASKTFNLASDVPDYAAFQRQIATSFERARFFDEALRVYERVLIGEPSNVSLLAKIAELHEQLGRDALAADIFGRAMTLMLARRPSTNDKVQDDDEAEDDPFARYWARNITDFEQYRDRVLKGLIVTTPDQDAAAGLLRDERSRIDVDLTEALAGAAISERPLEAFPRIRDRANYYRALAMAFRLQDDADALDLRILRTFPKDESLLRALVKERMQQGRVGSARHLIEGSGRSDQELSKVRYLAGAGSIDSSDRGTLRLPEVTRLFLPLIATGDVDGARRLIERGDFTSYDKEAVEAIGMLFSAAAMLEDADLMLTLGRHWITGIVHAEGQVGGASYQIESVLEKCGRVLDAERYRSLGQSIVGLILDDTKKDQTRDLVRLLPGLTRRFTEPLLTDEELERILESRLDGNAWGMGPILEMVPPERRAAMVRTMWPKIQKTMRAMFLLNLAGELQEEVTRELEDLLVDSMESAIADCDDKQFLSYYIDGVVSGKKNRRLAERLLSRMIASGADAPSMRLSHAQLLHEAGATTQALEEIGPTLRELFAQGTDDVKDWETEQAFDQLISALAKDHLDTLLAILDDVERESGASPALSMRRIHFTERKKDPKLTLEVTRLEQAKHPEDEGLLTQLDRALTSNNRRVEALELLQHRADKAVDEKAQGRLLTRLASTWESLRHATRAQEIWARIDAGRDKTKEKENDADKETDRKIARPSLVAIRDAIDRDDRDSARKVLRRLWRGDSPIADEGRMIFFSSFGRANSQLGGFWPADEDSAKSTAEETKTREWPRGGLPDWVLEDPAIRKAELEAEAQNRRRTYDVLVAETFGRAELERRMRVMTGPELSHAQDLWKALADDMIARLGAGPAFDEALQRITSGEANTQDYSILLEFLSKDSADFTALARPVLDELLNTTRPDDGQSLRRIAETLARTGDKESAAALYSWCATTSDAGPVYYSFEEQTTRVSSEELVKDVKEHLDGELRLNVVAKILDWADPGTNPWMRENYEELVLTTWSEVVGPDAALARCRELCESLMAPRPGDPPVVPTKPTSTDAPAFNRPHRESAKAAAALFARAGEIESALRCLETALVSRAGEDDEDGTSSMQTVFMSGGGMVTYFGGMADFGGGLSRANLEQLYPYDESGFVAPVEWMVGSAERIGEWVAEKSVSSSSGTEALTVIALRLHRLGATEEAARALALARAAAERDAEQVSLLWVADAAAKLGDPEAGYEIQRALLLAGELGVERIPETVEQILAREGSGPALEAGAKNLPLTHHPRLLDVLARAAEDAGDAAEAARYRELATSERAAEQTLEERREALAEQARREKAAR